MKSSVTVKIPLIKYKLVIYWDAGFDAFKTSANKRHPGWEFDNKMLGYQFENSIWIQNRNDSETLFHEVQHYFDWLFEHLGCEDEREFKANIASYVLCKLLKII